MMQCHGKLHHNFPEIGLAWQEFYASQIAIWHVLSQQVLIPAGSGLADVTDDVAMVADFLHDSSLGLDSG
jgi:hypothetical protein